MTYINPINVNTQGVGGNFGFGANSKPEKEEAKETEQAQTAEAKPQVSPDAVFSYMNQSAAISGTAPKTIDVSKYVDSASAERIAGFVANFEDVVAENLSAIMAEFPGISESSAMTVALSQVKA